MLTPEEFLEKYLEPDADFPPFTGTVTSALFTTDARFQNGEQMLLVWKVTDAPGDGDVIWGVGKIASGWVSPDGGKTLKNRDGKRLNGQSAYFRLLTQCGKFGLGQAVEDRGGAYSSAWGVGATFTFDREKIDYKGTIGVQNVRTVTEYLGGLGVDGEMTTPPTTKDFSAVFAILTVEQLDNLKTAATLNGHLSDWAMQYMSEKLSDPVFNQAILDPEFKVALAELM